jgi:hypothetical protein
VCFCTYRETVANADGFYLKAKANGGFSRQVIGQHTLEKILPRMMKEASVPGNFTLHSLRATCATRLYARGFDEQLIQERTGHASTSALREYKRTDDSLQQAVSHGLQCAPERVPISPSGGEIPPITTSSKKLRIECGGLKLSLNF